MENYTPPIAKRRRRPLAVAATIAAGTAALRYVASWSIAPANARV